MKHINVLRFISVLAILVLIIILVTGLIFANGVFVKDPKIEITPDNCYSETLHVITDNDYMPYSFKTDDGTMKGHDVELIALIANKLKMNLDIEFLPWANAIVKIEAGNADVLMTCDYSDEFDKEHKLLLTEDISEDDFIVYSKNKLSSDDDIYNKKIAIMQNGNVFAHIERKNLMDKCSFFNSNRDAMMAVEDGSADCAIMRYTIGEGLLKELGYKDISAHSSIGKSYMCFGIANNNVALKDRINTAIEELKTDGSLERLNEKWLTSFVHTKSFKEIIYEHIWMFLGVLFAIMAVLIFMLRLEVKKSQSEKERNFYVEIAEKLSNDFECVNYVELQEKKIDDRAILLRTSEAISRNLPEWNTEVFFSNRIKLFAENIVAPEYKDDFIKETKREAVIERLTKEKSYFVDFRAFLDGKDKYYQMKFTGIDDEDGKLKAFVVGIHNIDQQKRKEVMAQEALQAALESEKETEAKIEKDKALLDFFIKTFSSAYSVNLELDTFKVLHMEDSLKGLLADGEVNRKAINNFIENNIHPDDREMAYKCTEKEYINIKLRNNSHFIFKIREIIDGEEYIKGVVVIKVSDENHLAIGFMDISDQFKNQ